MNRHGQPGVEYIVIAHARDGRACLPIICVDIPEYYKPKSRTMTAWNRVDDGRANAYQAFSNPPGKLLQCVLVSAALRLGERGVFPVVRCMSRTVD